MLATSNVAEQRNFFPLGFQKAEDVSILANGFAMGKTARILLVIALLLTLQLGLFLYSVRSTYFVKLSPSSVRNSPPAAAAAAVISRYMERFPSLPAAASGNSGGRGGGGGGGRGDRRTNDVAVLLASNGISSGSQESKSSVSSAATSATTCSSSRGNISDLSRSPFYRLYNHKNTSQISTLPPSSSSSSGNWKEGTFCDDFLTKTFQLKAPVCSTNKSCLQEAIECYGNPHSHSMGTCLLRNVAVSPDVLAKVMYDPDRPKFEANRHSVVLLGGMDTECRDIDLDAVAWRMEGGDYVFKVVSSLAAAAEEEENKTSSQSPAVCDVWINETTLFFTAHRFHIYFRFLDYFNVHKLLEDFERKRRREGEERGGGGERRYKRKPFRVVRISGSDNYHFPEFDRALFPEAKVQALDDFKNVTTCFREVILVPKSYASTIFQCKSRMSLTRECRRCNGTGLNETDISAFSRRVLKACDSEIGNVSREEEEEKEGGDGRKRKLIVLVSRRPYLRNQNDKLERFQRVLDNERELVRALKEAFGKNDTTTVEVVHLENAPICWQVAHGRRADVFLGVHGSGLVHLWWMRDEALAYELEPSYQVGNPTFHMLSTLAGRNYQSEFVTGGYKLVRTDVRSVIENIKRYSKL